MGMDKGIITVALRLMSEAKKIAREEGLDKENEIINLVKTTSFLVWNNADPEIEEDYAFTMQVSEWECEMVDLLAELHHQRLKEIFNIG